MKALQSKIPFALMLALACAAITSFPSISQAEEFSRWELKTSAVIVTADKNTAIDEPAGGQYQSDGDAQVGLGVAVEYHYTDLISFEVARVSATAMDIDYTAGDARTSQGEGIRFMPILAGANFHFLNSKNLDLFAGPRVAFVNFGGFSTEINGETVNFKVENETAWGAVAGAKYKFGDGTWALLAEMTYLDVDTEITRSDNLETFVDSYNPLMMTIGLTHRF